jgi:hypothetical protein
VAPWGKRPGEPGDALRLPQALRDWLASAAERELRETARKLALKLDLTRSGAGAPRKRQRKPGAGHPPSLTFQEITRAQKIFRRELRRRPALKTVKRKAVLDHLRPLLKLKRNVSDDTLSRHVIRPVLSKHN